MNMNILEFKEKILIIPENLTTIYNLNKLFLKILNDKDKIIKPNLDLNLMKIR